MIGIWAETLSRRRVFRVNLTLAPAGPADERIDRRRE